MCLECAFFDDETEKKQFHCSSCGICRVGGREKFFHCNTCGCCYSRQLEVCNLPALRCPDALQGRAWTASAA
jgi:hypothetical protein